MTWQGIDQLANRQHYEHYNLSDRFLIMHEKPHGPKPMFKPAQGSHNATVKAVGIIHY